MFWIRHEKDIPTRERIAETQGLSNATQAPTREHVANTHWMIAAIASESGEALHLPLCKWRRTSMEAKLESPPTPYAKLQPCADTSKVFAQLYGMAALIKFSYISFNF